MSLAPERIVDTTGTSSTTSSTTHVVAAGAPASGWSNRFVMAIFIPLEVGRSIVSVTLSAVVGGTLVRVATFDRGEIWLAYGFNNTPNTANVTVTYDAATTRRNISYSFFRFSGSVTSAPTVGTPTSATATSTNAAPGAVTAAVNDLVLEFVGYESATAPSAVSDTPGVTELFSGSQAVIGAFSAYRASRVATTAGAHQRSLTIPNVAWTAVAVAVTITTNSPSLGAGHIYKGRASRSADTIGAA